MQTGLLKRDLLWRIKSGLEKLKKLDSEALQEVKR